MAEKRCSRCRNKNPPDTGCATCNPERPGERLTEALRAEARATRRTEELHRQFKERANLFTHMMGPEGGGIRTLAMLDTLRDLLTLYQDIAVHEDALLTLKGRV